MNNYFIKKNNSEIKLIDIYDKIINMYKINDIKDEKGDIDIKLIDKNENILDNEEVTG
jgi:hypothetical protein